jgi:hypothetical protein
MSASISASVGLGACASSAAALMICPDWQKPHLRDLLGDPGELDAVRALRVQSLDGRDAAVREIAQPGLPGAHRLAVHMHRAGAALGDAAAVLRAGQAEVVAQRPEQGHVGVEVKAAHLTVHGQFDHSADPPCRPF